MRAEASDRQAHRSRRRAAAPGHATRIAALLLEVAPTLDGLAGHAPGHAVRTCYLAMRLAEALSIGDRDRLGLFYAALLHDAGSVSDIDPGSGRPAMMRLLMPLPRDTEEERRAAEHLRVRRGAQFATRAGFGPEVTVTVMALHERWDGHGLPMGLSGERIPLFARIVALADGLDLAVGRDGRQAAITTIHAGSGRRYDPEIASVLLALCANGLLGEIQADDLEAAALDLEPGWLVRLADPEDAERIKSVLTSVGAA